MPPSMHRYLGFSETTAARGGYVSIGNFDGVHLGHQLMLRTLVEQATHHGLPSVVLTFDPHPISLLRPAQAPPLLTTMDQRAEIFASLGVEHLIVYPTDHQFLDLEPGEFFDHIVRQKLQARGLVEGPNFFYGKDRAGSIDTLRQASTAAGIEFTVIPPVRIEGRLVSSSSVREVLLHGNVNLAADLLGRPYQVTGTVVHGAERGRTIGFPTANLHDVPTLLPLDGVYAGRVVIDAKYYRAAMNLGPNPTFREEQRKFEVYILDFSGDLYDRPLTVEFLRRIRDTRRFESLPDLLEQVNKDVEFVRTLASH